MILSSQNKALQVSLRCLTHPLSLTMVGLLLLNDRLLKWQFASWWTGKLSDVAGLFFFPFVLTAAASLFWRRRSVGPAAILLVGWLFTLIKLIPVANGLAIQLWSALLGAPVAIVLDPTDLLALPVLGLTHWLWGREWDRPVPAKLSPIFPYLAALAWSVALLASLGSSCGEGANTLQVSVVERTAYAMLNGTVSYARFEPETMTWAKVEEETPGATFAAFFKDDPILSRLCVPDSDTICYDIATDGIVKLSDDGGQTWQAEWQYPFERLDFVELKHGCEGGQTRLDDIAILPASDGVGHYVIIAAGNEGILLRDTDGQWQRMAVFESQPTPFATNPLDGFFLITLEHMYFMIAALACSLILMPRLWLRWLWPWAVVVGIVMGLVTRYAWEMKLYASFSQGYFILPLLLWIVFLGLSRRYITQNGKIRLLLPSSGTATRSWLWTALLIYLVPIAIMLLWTMGLIARYRTAILLASFSVLPIFITGWREINHALQSRVDKTELSNMAGAKDDGSA